MRSLALTLIFALSAALLSGQIRQGDRILTPYNEGPVTLATAPPAVTSNLGGLFLLTEGEGVIVTALPQYGFAVSDRIVVGTSVIIGLAIGGGGDVAAGIAPYARYYLVNKPNLMAYSGLRAGLLLSEGNVLFGESTSLQPHLGIGLPLANGVLFAPELNYTIQDRRNSINLSLGFDFILGRNNRTEQRVAGSYGRGSWMFGTQLGGMGFGARFTTLRIMPEAYYFLGRRFALGLTSGTSLTLFDATSGRFRAQRSHIGLAGRYFPVQGRHFDIFTHAGFQLEIDNQDNGRVTGDPIVDNLAIMDGGIGGMLFIRNRVALEMGLNLRVYPQNEVAELGLNTGVRFFLGGGAGAVK